MKDIKQVIVIRKDLNMRKGKMCAQAAHASMAVFTKHTQQNEYEYYLVMSRVSTNDVMKIRWLERSFKKVVVSVDSEEELLELEKKAKLMGLNNAIIKDSGATEFHGVPTYTALAIGPNYSEQIDILTGDLKLL